MHFYDTISDKDRSDLASAQHHHDAQRAALKAKNDAYVASFAHCTHVMVVHKIETQKLYGAPDAVTVACKCANCEFVETHDNPQNKQEIGSAFVPTKTQCRSCVWIVTKIGNRKVDVRCSVCATLSRTYCSPHKMPHIGATVPTTTFNNMPSIA
ncbi:hypothetical protein UFOVP75_3 [uncultured Caudovirales phage]|uniref:Uncharacterized protein n=1 Tax=uncultured Caudovirales phage TaxID=2100421 RepID=A0A6J5KYY2_9CAUD|nr:hypothetical protein UFOVP75_3 [uncultured Caudovirales phage]